MITDPRSKVGLKSYAKVIRQALSKYVDENGKLDIVKTLEYELEDLGFDLQIVENDVMPKEYAITDFGNKILRIREDVYDLAAEDDFRHRFTLAHELGHILLHQDIRMARSNEIVKTYCNPEWQANEFASWLLCPIEDNKLSIKQISLKYGVSEQVAKIQISKIS